MSESSRATRLTLIDLEIEIIEAEMRCMLRLKRAKPAGSDESQSIVSELLAQTSELERHTYTKEWVQQDNTRTNLLLISAHHSVRRSK
jgi:hypothetical protein